MYVASAFAFTPAAIISEANVCRDSCSPIGRSPTASHTLSARPFTGSALDGFAERPGELGGGRVELRLVDADRAEEALQLALITYGEFLERTEPLIGHGVTQEARRLLVEFINARNAEKNAAERGHG
jgi:hypothetical protein